MPAPATDTTPRLDAAAPSPPSGKTPDRVASLTIVVVALAALATSWLLPWWVMNARAPQYGQRTLVVEVGPRAVAGDVREMDLLGHYVGISPMGDLASLERALAPAGMLAAAAGLLIAPWLRRRWLRFLMIVPVLLMPLVVLSDLKYWMTRAVNDLDPEAALRLLAPIDPKLMRSYDVGQFKVEPELGPGFYLAATAGLLGLGLAFATPLQRRRRGAAAAAAIVSATAAFGLLPPHAVAAEILAGGTGPAIGAALEAARDGDTIVVPRGVHRERLTVRKSVRLVGKPGAVIDGEGTGTVVRIEAGGVEVRGLIIRGSGDSYTTEDAGIRIDHASGVRVADTRIEDVLFGIFIAKGDDCVIEGSSVIGKDLPHVRRGDAIRLWYSSGCRLTENLVERSRDVILWYSSDTVVEDNVVRTSRYGLHYMYSNDNVFRRNRFEDNQVGAAIMYSRGIELTENAFSFSDGPAAYGLLLKDADDVFITGNRFVDNGTGLFFDGAPQARGGRVEVRGNLIARNGTGIALQPLSKRIRFWENAIIGNRTAVQILGTGTAEGNEWSVEGRGNYWSEALVYDADGDGVSDVPHRLESTYEVLADRHPVLAFFEATPAAEALDLAARMFPIFAPRPKLTDPHPLVAPPLTAWTRTEDGIGGHVAGFAGAGVALLSVVGVAVLGVRAVLS